MNKQKEIEILMQNRCTKKEAERYLKNGTIIYENPDEWIASLKDNGCYDGETIKDARDGRLTDIATVVYEDHEYLIAYVN